MHHIAAMHYGVALSTTVKWDAALQFNQKNACQNATYLVPISIETVHLQVYYTNILKELVHPKNT